MNLLAFSHGCYYRGLLEDWLQEEDISPKRVLEFGTIEAILACKIKYGRSDYDEINFKGA